MTFLAATLLVPLLVVALAVGAGLLVERLAGRRLPGVLIVPLGLGVLVGASSVPSTWSSLAPFGPWLAVALALLGWALAAVRGADGARGVAAVRARRGLRLGDPLEGRRPARWPVAAALATYVISLAPVLAAGRVTLTGYLLDGTVAIHLLGADQLLDAGRSFDQLPPSSASYALNGYFGAGYPFGAHALLGTAGRVSGLDMAWIYQPLLSLFLAVSCLVLVELLRRLDLSERAASIGAVLASVPALVYSYTLMGAIKEIGLLPFLLLLTVLAFDYRDHLATAGARAAVPLGVAVGACVAIVGISAGGWVGLVLAICSVLLLQALRLRRLTLRTAALQALVVAGIAGLLALPTVAELGRSLTLATSLSQTNETLALDPGNLLRPLRFIQIFGVWLSFDHRIDPPLHLTRTLLFIGGVILTLILGLAWAVGRRNWLAVALAAAWGIALWVLTRRGTIWLDAKLLVLTSPIVVAFAAAGALSLRRSGGRWLEALALTGLLALGIGLSTIELYRGTNLAPTDRLEELQTIGRSFDAAGGSAFVADFDEIALYFLRDLAPEGPGFAHRTARTATLTGGEPSRYGASIDADRLQWENLREFGLLVVRRGPLHSRPPSGFEPAFRGRYYEVFRKTPDAERTLQHIGAGSSLIATGAPDCEQVKLAADAARRDGDVLLAALRRDAIRLDPTKAYKVPRTWFANPAGGLSTAGPGNFEQGLFVRRAGRYRIWLEGDFNRELDVLIDGRRIGSVSYESGGEGNVGGGFETELSEGSHQLRIIRGSGGVRPGSTTPARVITIIAEPVDGARLVEWDPQRWRALCERTDVDWVELRRLA